MEIWAHVLLVCFQNALYFYYFGLVISMPESRVMYATLSGNISYKSKHEIFVSKLSTNATNWRASSFVTTLFIFSQRVFLLLSKLRLFWLSLLILKLDCPSLLCLTSGQWGECVVDISKFPYKSSWNSNPKKPAPCRATQHFLCLLKSFQRNRKVVLGSCQWSCNKHFHSTVARALKFKL